MIKITYETISDKMSKPEKTTIQIFDGRYFVSYDIKGKAESTVKKMLQDGKKGVLYSRGVMLQIFPKLNEEEILKIVEEDIVNGLKESKLQTGKELKISNYKIIR